MYTMKMEVDELKAIVHYDDFATAIKEFKECVVEVFDKTDENDNYIMKITQDYALFIVECKLVNFRIELVKGE